MQMLAQQLKQMEQQAMEVEKQLMELEAIKQALTELPNTKEGTEMLVPISQGIYVKGAVKDTKELIVNVGAGTGVSKSVQEASSMVSTQINQVRDFQMKMMGEVQALSARMQQLEKELSGA